MFKKLVIAAAAVVVGLVVLRVTTFGSLLHVWWNDASRFVERQVPPETRLKQLKLEVDKIDGDIKTAVKNLVRLEVGHDDLKKDITTLQAKQEQSKEDMHALIEGLEQGKTLVVLRNHTLPSGVAQIRLDGLRNEYENRKETLKIKQELLTNKAQQLEAADKRITRIQEKKAELTALVANMEAQLERLRTKQLDTPFEVNDTQVSKCENLANSLRKTLAEEEKIAEKYARYGIEQAEQTVPAQQPSTSKEEIIRQAKRLLSDEVAGK